MKWISCDKCGKWRKLAENMTFQSIRNSATWICKYNTWSEYKKCTVPEEYWKKSDIYSYYTNTNNRSAKTIKKLEKDPKKNKDGVTSRSHNYFLRSREHLERMKQEIQRLHNPWVDSDSIINTSDHIGCVYLIQPPELKSTNRYKVGFSKNNGMYRTNSYGKNDSRILSKIPCKNPLEVERKILLEFRKQFKSIEGRREFFEDLNTNEHFVVKLFDKVALDNIVLK